MSGDSGTRPPFTVNPTTAAAMVRLHPHLDALNKGDVFTDDQCVALCSLSFVDNDSLIRQIYRALEPRHITCHRAKSVIHLESDSEQAGAIPTWIRRSRRSLGRAKRKHEFVDRLKIADAERAEMEFNDARFAFMSRSFKEVGGAPKLPPMPKKG